MPCIISGGKISTVIMDNFAETDASFYIAPPFDGEVLLPFIPKGIIFDLKILKDGAVISETKVVNIRELNAMSVSNLVLISRRIDGCVVLKVNKADWDTPVEVRVKCVSYLLETKECSSLIFPAGFGDSVMADVSVKVLDGAFKINSPTHKTVTSVLEKTVQAEICADINGESLILNIFRNIQKRNALIVSRRLFGDNLAYCTFAPSAGEENEVNTVYIEPIGGIGVKLLNDKAEYRLGEYIRCFAIHSIIPPKGMRIKDKNGDYTEEIYFESVSTNLVFMPVELIYAEEKIKILQDKMENAPFEERCIIREEINDICIKYKMAMGDIALASILGGENSGLISGSVEDEKESKGYLFENAKVNPDDVIDRILNSQTVDGIIADIWVYEENMLVFSTAVCLIALYLYTGNTYSKFAKRSIDFLKDRNGYWVNTALKLWNGENIDIDHLTEKSEMKIMYRRLDELAVSIIKDFRRR